MALIAQHWIPIPALLIIVLAGVSEGFGTDGILLFLRRINRRSFIASVLFSGVMYTLGALAWIGTMWLIAQQFVATPLPLWIVVQHVGAGYIPLLFAGFAITPYIGPFLLHLLHAYSLLVVVGIIHQIYGIPLWQSGLIVGSGWLVAQLVRRLARHPGRTIRSLGWQVLTGSPNMPQLSDLPPRLQVHVVMPSSQQEGN